MGLLTGTNITIDGSGPSHVTHEYETTIHEHRAPTDQSVRLLREMEDAAEQRVIRRVKVEGNDMNAMYVEMYKTIGIPDKKFYLTFTLNGEDHQLTGDINSNDSMLLKGGQDIVKYILNSWSEIIAFEMLKNSGESLREIMRNLQ